MENTRIESADKLSAGLFYLAFSIRFLSSGILSSELANSMGDLASIILNIFNVIVILLILLKIFYQHYHFSNLLLIIIVSAIILITTVKSGSNDVLISWLFIISVKDADIKKLSKMVIAYSVIVVLLLSGLSVLGLIDNSSFIRDNSFLAGNNGRIRYTLGFSNPNIVGMYFLQMVVAIVVIRDMHLKTRDYLISILMALFVNYFVNSRTAVLLIILLLLLTYFYSHKKYIKKGPTIIATLSLFGSSLASLYIATFYTYGYGGLIQVLDVASSGRMYFSNQYYKRYGYTLLGTNVDYTRFSSYLDNAYVHLTIVFGIIVFLLYILAVWSVIKYESCHQNNTLLIVIAIFMLQGIMESSIINVTRCYILLELGNVICSENRNKKIRIMWKDIRLN